MNSTLLAPLIREDMSDPTYVVCPEMPSGPEGMGVSETATLPRPTLVRSNTISYPLENTLSSAQPSLERTASCAQP